jgi:hypothetical protein
MSKPVFIILIICSILSAQDITISKDSILVYNNPMSSYADEVIFTSHSNTPIHLDSAFVMVEELDTVGYGRPGMQLSWKTTLPTTQEFVWAMDTAEPNNFRLVKNVFYPGTAEPLTFAGIGTTSQMFFLEIGYCFQCELFPKYPRYIKGLLKLYFSNGQMVELKIKSNDLRTAVRQPFRSYSTKNEMDRAVFLVNGRMVANGMVKKRLCGQQVMIIIDYKKSAGKRELRVR